MLRITSLFGPGGLFEVPWFMKWFLLGSFQLANSSTRKSSTRRSYATAAFPATIVSAERLMVGSASGRKNHGFERFYILGSGYAGRLHVAWGKSIRAGGGEVVAQHPAAYRCGAAGESISRISWM